MFEKSCQIQKPLNCGGRFSTNAFTLSRKSSLRPARDCSVGFPFHLFGKVVAGAGV
jgi:hypothetical protein